MANKAVRMLNNWYIEATSGHNDGYIRKHYWDKIKEVEEAVKRYGKKPSQSKSGK